VTSSVLEVTPPGTLAAMIDAVVHAQHPRLAIPSIASRFNITLADLQSVLHKAGYPNTASMRAAAAALRAQAIEEADQADTNAAAPMKPTDVDDKRERLVRVAITDLHPDPNNLREHLAVPAETDNGHIVAADDIEQLADSIRELGLIQKIVARRTENGHLVIVAGHRRFAAIQRLQWTHVDVIVRPPMRPDDVVAAMLIENGQRRDLDPIEEARGIRKLKAEHNLTDIKLARKIGRSQSYVSARLALLNLTPEEQEQVRAGELGIGGATNLGRLKAGKVRQGSKGNVTIPYFGPTNDLASRAQARCKRLGHRNKIAGGVACGSCWESVIRADERDHLQELNAKADDCVTCGHPLDHTGQGS
jgi:ParB family chromosome partitioning protein